MFLLAPVLRLLFGRSPSAIAGLVVSCAVDTVDRAIPIRASFHVKQEALEPAPPKLPEPPAVADLDAASPVSLIVDRVGVVAPRDHRSVGSIGDRVDAGPGGSRIFSTTALAQKLPPQASATFGRASDELPPLMDAFGSTVAATPPESALRGVSAMKLDNQQSAETVPG